MGLAICTGMLADLKENDEDGFNDLKEAFEAVSVVLDDWGEEPHVEPESCEVWSAEMYGYSGLHYLRRIAAHLDCGNELPEPGEEDAADDPVINAYYDSYYITSGERLHRKAQGHPHYQHGYDHLMVHSDAEGFYLPLDSEYVMIKNDGPELVPGGEIGSVPRLLKELDRLAEVLGIPDHLHAQSDELWDAADSQGEGEALWQRYGIESYTCVVLREGCRKSLASGSALVFT